MCGKLNIQPKTSCAWENPGGAGIVLVFAVVCWHSCKAVPVPPGCKFPGRLPRTWVNTKIAPRLSNGRGAGFWSSKGVGSSLGIRKWVPWLVTCPERRASSLTWELWRLVTLNKAFLLTKTASCQNCVLLMMWTRGQSLALKSSFMYNCFKNVHQNLRNGLRKQRVCYPITNCLLYCYMAAV